MCARCSAKEMGRACDSFDVAFPPFHTSHTRTTSEIDLPVAHPLHELRIQVPVQDGVTEELRDAGRDLDVRIVDGIFAGLDHQDLLRAVSREAVR